MPIFAAAFHDGMRVKQFLIGIFLCNIFGIQASPPAGRFALQGKITDKADGQALNFVTIQLFSNDNFLSGQLSTTQGDYRFDNLAEGIYRLHVSHIGYETTDSLVHVRADRRCNICLSSSALSLNEVIVTASEKKGLTATTVINRTAMQHLQPSSFSDLLSLLPGGSTSTPHTNRANVIRLREVGMSGSDYAISSLGTKFIIDGAPVGTDANMQGIAGGTSADDKRNYAAYGVDMRTLSTDNIASVEVVRGIPSVKYGDLTSGLVNIRRKQTASPFEARMKADEYGKLFSMGKGFSLSHGWTLNTDGGFFRSMADPRNKFETYSRLNFSSRLHKFWSFAGGAHLYWDLSADYSGNIDNVKTDPEVQLHLEDKYRSAYHHGGLSTALRYRPKAESLLRSISLAYSTSLSADKIDQTKFVSVDRDTHTPLEQENGEYDASYLPATYIARHQVKGLPFYSNLRLETALQTAMGKLIHRLTLGGEWQYNKNFGDGQVYDFRRPLDGTSARRPRAFKDIPATNLLAFYAEDEVSLPLSKHLLTIMAGIRGTTMAGIAASFVMHGKLYYDPRVNFLWDFPSLGRLKLYASAGWGRMSKMPTMGELYPEKRYLDFVQLNYWNKNEKLKRVNIRTYTIDTNNYGLRPAHNNKVELRLGGSYDSHQFYVTYFHEKMNDGFRSIQQIIPMLTYKRYDTSGIDGSKLTAPPALEALPYRMDTLLRTTTVTGNGTVIVKEGIEFQYASPRVPLINTRLTINGAWFHSTYGTALPEYYAGSFRQINGITISNRFIGLYEWSSGYVKDQFSSNIIADTYLDKLGLILSATAECFWLGRMRAPSRLPRPVAYVDVEGNQHAYTDADASDLYKRWLILGNQKNADMIQRERAYMCLNIKTSKRFGRYATLAFFADRLLNIAPDYEVDGFIARRVFTPYLGMELNIQL